MIITRNCDNCQSEYLADTRYLKRNQGMFCSRSCSSSRPRVEHESNTICSICQAGFYRKPSRQQTKSGLHFCSKKCQDKAYADRLVKTGPDPIKNPHRSGYAKMGKVWAPLCLGGCGRGTKSQTGLCPTCDDADIIDAWLSGDNDITLYISSTTGLPTDTKKFVKRYLIETRGDRCEDCGFSGVNRKTGNSIIQMDHINGNCFDNAPENLKLLCPNCHAMTETYGSLNKGSGRTHRRKSD